MIEISHLYYRYDEQNEALRDVSLVVPDGQYVAILGHNGSGKSTLAMHLNGLMLPSAGDVAVDGLHSQNPADAWALRQRVGLVFQNPDNQLIATSVEEDTAFGPENLGVEPQEIRIRVDEALASVGMGAYKDKAVHLLSGGQKQRVAIAGIMAMRPRVLVLDEPTAMLDPQGRQEVLDAVRTLNREEGITVIYITHIMEEATCADRVLVMEEGSIVMDGTPREIFSQVETLRGYSLDVPVAVDIAHRLRDFGYAMPTSVLTLDELAEALCP